MDHILRPTPDRRGGFTLIELMIAVAIVSILAAVALPSFFDSLRKSRRAEAYNAIAAVQQAQERWRSNKASYSGELTALPDATPPGLGLQATTASGRYTLALRDATPTGYIVSAVAVAGSSQAKDLQCLKMAARMAGGQITYAGCQSCSLEPTDFSESNPCWNR